MDCLQNRAKVYVNECVGGSVGGRVKVKVEKWKAKVRRAEVGVWWKEGQSCRWCSLVQHQHWDTQGQLGGRRAKTDGAR